MSTKLLISTEEYLHTSFDGADCDFVDGEVVERNMGEGLHSTIQTWLSYLLVQMARSAGIRVLLEIRIQINASRYRVADIAVWRRSDEIGSTVPKTPPFLAIEILSPEDRHTRMVPKIQDYLSAGVESIWIIDPEEKKAIIYTKSNPAGVVTDVLRTEDSAIELPLAEVLAPRI